MNPVALYIFKIPVETSMTDHSTSYLSHFGCFRAQRTCIASNLRVANSFYSNTALLPIWQTLIKKRYYRTCLFVEYKAKQRMHINQPHQHS